MAEDNGVEQEEFVDLTQNNLPESEIEAEEVKAKEQDEIPEKYRGKALKDVIQMHQNAEKLASRHAQEVGEIRKLADDLIKAQLTKKPEVEQPKDVDFFENPQEAIRQAVENNPKVKAAEEQAIFAQRQIALQQLQAKHPDFAELNADPSFQDWVKGSKVRTKLYIDANNYDFDSADELLSTYKQLKSVQKQAISDTEKAARNNALKAASVDSGGTGESGKKIYRRADLIRMMAQDRPRYEAMQDEITRAYQEGRVR